MLADEIQTRRYALRPDVVATVLEDGALLFDLETKYFYRLNPTGWAITQLFESGAALQDVIAQCHVMGSPINEDGAIYALFETLSSEKLIAVSDDTAANASEERLANTQWTPPTIEKQAEPLQKVIISAFDPSVPLVE